VLQNLLRSEAGMPDIIDKDTPPKVAQQFQAINDITDLDGATAEKPKDDKTKGDKTRAGPADTGGGDEDLAARKALLNKSLVAMSPLFGNILGAIKNRLNLLPPAAAMAGIYTMVDNSRGVWKAPANVSLNAVVSPAVNISHDDQEDLNVTTQGKSINAIRSFIGEGTLVWGARTLDGNSLDWRYINVRRTMIMLEESIRLATKAYVFEPNDANTWVTIRSMIRNFLTGIWKRGGLAGAVPDDAFSVHVGLGETMTSEDILEGILRVTVLVAVSRPAEFIEITFQQQMQKS
jgi:phage tail sheath protein FI